MVWKLEASRCGCHCNLRKGWGRGDGGPREEAPGGALWPALFQGASTTIFAGTTEK